MYVIAHTRQPNHLPAHNRVGIFHQSQPSSCTWLVLSVSVSHFSKLTWCVVYGDSDFPVAGYRFVHQWFRTRKYQRRPCPLKSRVWIKVVVYSFKYSAIKPVLKNVTHVIPKKIMDVFYIKMCFYTQIVKRLKHLFRILAFFSFYNTWLWKC